MPRLGESTAFRCGDTKVVQLTRFLNSQTVRILVACTFESGTTIHTYRPHEVNR